MPTWFVVRLAIAAPILTMLEHVVRVVIRHDREADPDAPLGFLRGVGFFVEVQALVVIFLVG